MAFNGRFVLNLAHFTSKIGGDFNQLIELSGYSIEELQKEDCTIDNQHYNAVIEEAVKTTKDPCFGLHAGENLNLAAAGLIVQLSQSSASVKEALNLSCEYANLGCSVLPMYLEEREENYRISFQADPDWRSQSELAFQHLRGANLLGDQIYAA